MKANRLRAWSTTCTTPPDHYLSLHGPRGAVRHVELVGEAVGQARKLALADEVLPLLQMASAILEGQLFAAGAEVNDGNPLALAHLNLARAIAKAEGR